MTKIRERDEKGEIPNQKLYIILRRPFVQWKYTRNEGTHNRYFETVDLLQDQLSEIFYNLNKDATNIKNQITTPGSGKVDPESNAFQLSFTGGSLNGYSIQRTFTGILDKPHGEAIFSAFMPKGNDSCNVKYGAPFSFSN